MQHITIKPMTIARDEIEARRHVDLIALRLIATLVMLWFVTALYALVASADRAAELAGRI